MARRVYFAFDYQDVFSVNQIRNAAQFVDRSVAGFHDASQWEKLKQKDDAVIKKAIDDALVGTTVTVVCVGARTSSRRWVKYELKASAARGNGLLGVYLPGESGHTKPSDLGEAPLYGWNASRFADWVEAAATRAGR
ncbi:MAG: TIR domain-containing protein [Solirubrobacterales bacterium]